MCEDLIDYASASDTESELIDGEQRACHHCYTCSKVLKIK